MNLAANTQAQPLTIHIVGEQPAESELEAARQRLEGNFVLGGRAIRLGQSEYVMVPGREEIVVAHEIGVRPILYEPFFEPAQLSGGMPAESWISPRELADCVDADALREKLSRHRVWTYVFNRS
jgi:hypothetical protein